MNQNINSLIISVISGFISGLIIYFGIGWAEKRKWGKAKLLLINEFSGYAFSITLASRIFLHVGLPKKVNKLVELKAVQACVRETIDSDIIKKWESFSKIIEFPNEEDLKTLIISLERTKKLLLDNRDRLLLFRFSEPKHIIEVEDLISKISSTLFVPQTFPEIFNRSFDSDVRLKSNRIFFSNSLLELIKTANTRAERYNA